MKHALNFANKLNSRDIFKNVIIVFWYPPMICSPLLAKKYFPAQWHPAWSSLLSQLVDNYGIRGGCSKGASFTRGGGEGY